MGLGPLGTRFSRFLSVMGIVSQSILFTEETGTTTRTRFSHMIEQVIQVCIRT